MTVKVLDVCAQVWNVFLWLTPVYEHLSNSASCFWIQKNHSKQVNPTVLGM